MQTELIKLAHEKGHFSSAKTEEIVKREFFIPNLSKQVQNVIINCVSCILANKKCGKKEGFLNPIPKEDVPLSTYHVDFIGPLPSTNKRYQHILTIIDAFTKFTWLYPVKSTTLEDALDKLKLQQKTFGNPKRIITDRGSPFNSKGFDDYCTEEKIQNLQITTGVPRGNGQVERIHRTLIPVLTKLSIDDSTKWYKFVDRLQRILNSTSNRSTKWSPFELLTGVTMRNREDLYLRNLLMEEMVEELQEQRNQLRQDAKRNIQKIQAENKRTYDRKRKKAPRYQKGDLVAIQRTQFGSGVGNASPFFGGVRGTPRNSSACKQQQGLYTNYCCNPYGKAAPITPASPFFGGRYRTLNCNKTTMYYSIDMIFYSKDNLVALHFKYDQARRRFVEWAQNEIAVVPDFHKRTLLSDEAHFWLNGYVNKQNCRIWSEGNPQVYVETPLHLEKLTVWCTLWAGGILLQKR
ncbi:hypothetical protein TNCV_470531 [Trichonephila clavipes]|nr:hypothetical protein TNCV_470531 [Trichonephila clavipes]